MCSTTSRRSPSRFPISPGPSSIRSAEQHPSSMRPRRCLDPAPGSALPASSGRGTVDRAAGGGRAYVARRRQRAQLALLERLRQGRAPSLRRARAVGPGLAELYQAIAASRGLQPAPLQPNDVLVLGLSGEDEVAGRGARPVHRLARAVRRRRGPSLGARGGVYFGGGIAPKLAAKLSSGRFARPSRRKAACSLSGADPGLCDPRRVRGAQRCRFIPGAVRQGFRPPSH